LKQNSKLAGQIDIEVHETGEVPSFKGKAKKIALEISN